MVFTAEPPFRVKAVVVAVVFTLDHWFTTFCTFNEPSPVAASYPAVVVNAGAVGLAAVTSKPGVHATWLLQFVLPPVHGTSLLPFVTSLNLQLATGALDELQLRFAVFCCCASAYK